MLRLGRIQALARAGACTSPRALEVRPPVSDPRVPGLAERLRRAYAGPGGRAQGGGDGGGRWMAMASACDQPTRRADHAAQPPVAFRRWPRPDPRGHGASARHRAATSRQLAVARIGLMDRSSTRRGGGVQRSTPAMVVDFRREAMGEVTAKDFRDSSSTGRRPADASGRGVRHRTACSRSVRGGHRARFWNNDVPMRAWCGTGRRLPRRLLFAACTRTRPACCGSRRRSPVHD